MLHFLQRPGTCYIFSTLPWHSCMPSTHCIHHFHFPVIAKELIFGFCPDCSCRCFAVLVEGGSVRVWHCTLVSGAFRSAWGWDGWQHKGASLGQQTSYFRVQSHASSTANTSTCMYFLHDEWTAIRVGRQIQSTTSEASPGNVEDTVKPKLKH